MHTARNVTKSRRTQRKGENMYISRRKKKGAEKHTQKRKKKKEKKGKVFE